MGARLRRSYFHYSVKPPEGFNLPAALRRIAKQRHKSRSESVSGTIALEKFRHNICPQDKVSKDRRRQIEAFGRLDSIMEIGKAKPSGHTASLVLAAVGSRTGARQRILPQSHA